MIHFLPFHICQLLNSLPLMYMKPDPFQAEIRPTGHYYGVPPLPLACEQALWSTLAVGWEKEGELKTFLLHRRLLCCGRLGRKKKTVRRAPFPSSHRSPARFLFFRLLLFF